MPANEINLGVLSVNFLSPSYDTPLPLPPHGTCKCQTPMSTLIFAGSIGATPPVCITFGIVDVGTTPLAVPSIQPLTCALGTTTLTPVRRRYSVVSGWRDSRDSTSLLDFLVFVTGARQQSCRGPRCRATIVRRSHPRQKRI